MVGALEAVDHVRVGIAVARQQSRALELQGERGERVREHVVQLAGDAAALGQRGGLGVRGARIAQLLDVLPEPPDQPHDQEPRQDENRIPAITAGLVPSAIWIATSPTTVPPQTRIAASRSSRMPPIAITK